MDTISFSTPFSYCNIYDGRLKLCAAWQTSGIPLVYESLLWRLPDGLLGQSWKHLTSHTQISHRGKLWHHLKILVMTKIIRVCECAPWCQLQFSILSHQTTWDFKRPFMSFLCVCISSSPQTVNPPACLFNIKPKWSIAKHWFMKSKPLIYPCFKTTVIFFPFSFSVAFVHC